MTNENFTVTPRCFCSANLQKSLRLPKKASCYAIYLCVFSYFCKMALYSLSNVNKLEQMILHLYNCILFQLYDNRLALIPHNIIDTPVPAVTHVINVAHCPLVFIIFLAVLGMVNMRPFPFVVLSAHFHMTMCDGFPILNILVGYRRNCHFNNRCSHTSAIAMIFSQS